MINDRKMGQTIYSSSIQKTFYWKIDAEKMHPDVKFLKINLSTLDRLMKM